MEKYKVSNFIFSSTAGVYDSENLVPPFQEGDTKKTIHPYASSKLIIEEILFQLSLTNKIRSISLRYFNVIGAHES
jgi:UDP-glucose 4-epimerase